MRESLVIILTVHVSLVLCQVLDNRQQTIDDFIAIMGQQNRNESRPVRPFQNPNQQSNNQFGNGQNQGGQQPSWNGPNQGGQQQPQQNTGRPNQPPSNEFWNSQNQGGQQQPWNGQNQGGQQQPQQNTGRPNQPPTNQFWNGQNQGPQQQPWNGQNQGRPQQPQQNTGQPNQPPTNQFWNSQNQGGQQQPWDGQNLGEQQPSPQNAGQPSFNQISYPVISGQSSNRPTQNANPCGRAECVPYYKCANGSTIRNGLLDIRFGQEDNTYNRNHPCPGLFETCCTLRSEKPIVPPNTKVNAACGIRNVNGVGFRITGDKDGEAQFGEFPWTVAILKEDKAFDGQILNIFVCGGSIIDPGVILTAAHCVDKKEAFSLKIRAGEWDTQTNDEIFPHQDRYVRDYVIHPEYRRGTQYNDIALLFLAEPVTIAENVNVACLPRHGDTFDGVSCFASGWGKDQFGANGRYQVILKRVELPIVPRDYCVDKLRNTRLGKHFQLHNSFICAGGELGRDTCKGDGGSPLVCHVRNGQYAQAGIVSWGIGCGAQETPAVYTNVALFRHWIDQQMESMRYSTSAYYL